MLPSDSDDDLVDDDVIDDEVAARGTRIADGVAPTTATRSRRPARSRSTVDDAESVVRLVAGRTSRTTSSRSTERRRRRSSRRRRRCAVYASIAAIDAAATAGAVAADDGLDRRRRAPSPARAARRSIPTPRAPDRARGRAGHPRADVTLTSKRLGEFEAGRETADLLTADRLLDPHQVVRPEPEGAWQHFVYSITGHRINLGDGKRARARKELDRRIAAPLERRRPLRAGALAQGRRRQDHGHDPARHGAGRRARRPHHRRRRQPRPRHPRRAHRRARAARPCATWCSARAEVTGYNDFSSIVARDETRLDVLASDTDPRVSEAFNDSDYNDVADARRALLLDRADRHRHRHRALGDGGDARAGRPARHRLGPQRRRGAARVRDAHLARDQRLRASRCATRSSCSTTARPGTPLVQLDEIEAHFRTRVRDVVRVPYDPHIAAGSAITFRDLQPATRLAARELAASVVEGLRALAPAA